MTRWSAFLSAILAVALMAGPSLAGDPAIKSKAADPAVTTTTYTENQLVGLSVVDKNGVAIGKIKDVNVDSATGNINFVILAKGDVKGDEHALPLGALAIRSDEGKATLLVPADKLAAAPARASGMSDNEYRGHIEEYYGVAPIWNAPTGESKSMHEKMEEHPAGSNY